MYPTPSVPRRQRTLFHHQDMFANPRDSQPTKIVCAWPRSHGTDDRATTLLDIGSHASGAPYRILDAQEGKCSMTIFSNLDPTGLDGLTPETLVTSPVNLMHHKIRICQT